jgi:glycosyltransferase involved in cell wall biosynthesis
LLNRLWLGRLYRFTCTPDKTRRWHKVAIQHCLEVHRKDPVDCIYTSSNPLSAHLIGQELAQELDRPWVAEFRDPWTTNPGKSWETKLHFRYERLLERQVLSNSDHVVINTPVARQQILQAFPGLRSDKVSTVPNSFDPSVMEGVDTGKRGTGGTVENTDEMKIAHVGTMRALMPTQQKQTSLKKQLFNTVQWGGRYSLAEIDRLGNSPWYFAHGLRHVYNRYPEWEGKIRLVIAGRLAASKDKIEKFHEESGLPQGTVKHIGVLPHEGAIGLMRESDALMVNLAYPADMRATPVVPAKIYEYLATGKPILGLLPPGDARDLVDKSGLGYLAPPNAPEEIAHVLTRLYRDFLDGNLPTEPDKANLVKEYNSNRLADQMWDIFHQVRN